MCCNTLFALLNEKSAKFVFELYILSIIFKPNSNDSVEFIFSSATIALENDTRSVWTNGFRSSKNLLNSAIVFLL